MALANFVQGLVEKDETIIEPRKRTALDACGAVRRAAYNAKYENNEELRYAYILVLEDTVKTLRFYVRELQYSDKLQEKARMLSMGYSYGHYVATRIQRRPRRIIKKDA